MTIVKVDISIDNFSSGESPGKHTDRPAEKKSFWRGVGLALICAALFIPLEFVLEHAEKINPNSNRIEGLEFSDMLFAKVQRPGTGDGIVLINCARDSRDEIARKIGMACRSGSAAVGVDLEFSLDKDERDDIALIDTLKAYKDDVLLVNQETPFLKKLNKANAGPYPNIGYIPELKTLDVQRNFQPYRVSGDGRIDTFFSVKLMNMARRRLPSLPGIKSEPGDKVVVNFRNGYEKGPNSSLKRYVLLDTIPSDSLLLKNKIVLLGGMDSNSLVDKHFSPLNGILGRAHPDMYGTVYLAQVVSMIIEQDFLKKECPALLVVLTCLACYCSVRVHQRIEAKKRLQKYVHWLVLFYILCMSGFLLLVSFILFHYKIKFEPVHYLVPAYLSFYVLEAIEFVHHFFKKHHS